MGQGRVGEVAMGDNRQLNGLKAIDGQGWLRRGLTRGLRKGGGTSRCRAGQQTWLKVAEKWRWTWLKAMQGKKKGLTGGIHMSRIGKRENASVKVRNLAYKAHLVEDTKRAPLNGPVKEVAACWGGMAWLGGLGRLARTPGRNQMGI
jgi:hypothetical protein